MLQSMIIWTNRITLYYVRNFEWLCINTFIMWTSFCAIWLQKTNFLWKVVSAVRFIFDHFLQTSDSWIYSSWELRIFISCKIPDKPAIQDKRMLFCDFFPWVTKRRMMMPWGTWKVLSKLGYFIFLSVLVQGMSR